MSADVFLPEGTLCVGDFYALTSNYIGNGPVEWVVLTSPPGVEVEDVTFLGQFRPNALVSVPLAGTYSFALECCEPA